MNQEARDHLLAFVVPVSSVALPLTEMISGGSLNQSTRENSSPGMFMGLRLLLPAFLLACGGDSSGPRDADVVGTWLVTFTTTGACQLGQIALILSESPSGAPLGNHGSYVISCVGSLMKSRIPGRWSTGPSAKTGSPFKSPIHPNDNLPAR